MRVSAAVDLLEVVALVAVALFLLVGVVVASQREATLLALLLWRLGSPALALAPTHAVRAQVCAAGRQVLAAAASALGIGGWRTRLGRSLRETEGRETRIKEREDKTEGR